MPDPNAGFDKMNGAQFGLIMSEILQERARQNVLKDEGRFDHTLDDKALSNGDRLACVDEEIGEVAREILELRRLVHDRPRHEQPGASERDKLRKELIQVAALVVAWLEGPCNALPLLDS